MSKCSTEAPFCVSPTPTEVIKITPAVSLTPVYVTPTPTFLSPAAIEKEKCEELIFDLTKFPTITSSKNFDINTYNSQITGIENAVDNSFIIQQASTIDKTLIDLNRDTVFNNIGDTRFNAAAALSFLKARFKPLEPEDESFKKPITIPVISCNADGDPYTYYINNSSIIFDGCNKNTVILPIYDFYGQIVSFPLKNSFNKLLTTEAVTAVDSTDQIITFPLKNINNERVCYPFRDLSQKTIYSLPTQNTDRLVDVAQARVNLSAAYDNARDAHALKFAKYLISLEKKGTCISFFVSVVGSSVTSLELDNVEVFGVAVYKTCPDCAELTNYLSTYINCFIRYYPDRACYVYELYKKLGGQFPFTRIDTEDSRDIFISEKASYLAYNILKSPFWSPQRDITLLPCERRMPNGGTKTTTVTNNKIIDIYDKLKELSARLEECCNRPDPTPFPTQTPNSTPFPTQTSNSTPFPTQTPMPTPGGTPAPTPAPTPATTPAATKPAPPPPPPVCDPIPVIVVSNSNTNTYDPTFRFPGGTDFIRFAIRRVTCRDKTTGTSYSTEWIIDDDTNDWSFDKYPSSRTDPNNNLSRTIYIGSLKQGTFTLSKAAEDLIAPTVTKLTVPARLSFLTPDIWDIKWTNKIKYWDKDKALDSKTCNESRNSCPAVLGSDIDYFVPLQGVEIQAKFGNRSSSPWLDPANPLGPPGGLFGPANPCLTQKITVSMYILNNVGGVLQPFTDPVTKKPLHCTLGRGGATYSLDCGLSVDGDTRRFDQSYPAECYRGDPRRPWDGGALSFYWDKTCC